MSRGVDKKEGGGLCILGALDREESRRRFHRITGRGLEHVKSGMARYRKKRKRRGKKREETFARHNKTCSLPCYRVVANCQVISLITIRGNSLNTHLRGDRELYIASGGPIENPR